MNCQEAGALIEQEQFEQLPLRKRVGLRFHLLICKCCSGYKKDVTRMNSIIKSAEASHSKSTLSEKEKADIKSALNN